MTDSEIAPNKVRINFHRLGLRLAANLASSGLIGFGLIIIFVATLISSRFETLENADIGRHFVRTERMLSTLQDTIRDKSLDWSLWTATYDFINDQNQDYIDENISLDSMSNLGVQAAAFVGIDGISRQSVYYDVDQGDVDQALTDEFTAFATAPENLLRAREAEHFQGFVRIADHLLVVSFSQIKTSDGTGEANGYIVFGSELKNETMAEALQVPASFSFSPKAHGATVTKTSDDIFFAIEIHSIQGTPLAEIQFVMPRVLEKTSQSLLAVMALGIASLLLAMIVVLNRQLRSLVILPLAAMERHVSHISSSGELVQMPSDGRRDEIGKLTTGFNEMTLQLNLMRSKLEIQSFELGQTQKSIDIMHNVRNGLSPINPILANLTGLTEAPLQGNVAKAIDELRSESLDSDRRTKLVSFLQMSLQQYNARMSQAQGLIVEADQSVAAVVAAIEQSQSGTDSRPEITPVAIRDLVSQNLTLAQYAKNATIDVNMDDLAPGDVDSNRILLGQVLNNILLNATEAITAGDRKDGQIEITGEAATSDEKSVFRLLITDNGEGFDPAMANRLFERGFSTRSEKSGGTGLHWTANTLNTIGGSLTISSAGKGRGATVEILLPLSIPHQGINAPHPTTAAGFAKAS